MLSKGLALKRRSAMVTLLTAARLLRAECSPPVDPITREWYCPQARIPGLLTFRPLDRFRPSCVFDQHCSECGAFATYRLVSCLFTSTICRCITDRTS